MICVNDCSKCKNKLPKIDGWLACCKAFPNGQPDDFDYSKVRSLKECNNGIGFEPKEDNDKPSE